MSESLPQNRSAKPTTPWGGAAITADTDSARLQDELGSLLELLPAPLARAISRAQDSIGALQDVRLDVGSVPEVVVDEKSHELTDAPVVTQADIDAIDAAVQAHGGRYNDQLRATTRNTIHRITPLKNGDHIIGFTLRPARIAVVDDFPLGKLVMPKDGGQRRSLLIIGPPGSGKSTKLRALIRELSEDFGLGRSVVVCDDSAELGGSGDKPHPGLGKARRLPHVDGESQAFLMRQAVRNHGARVLCVDEIAADRQEVFQAIWGSRTGVTMIGTTHASSLQDVVENKTLDLLIGGVESAPVKDQNMDRNAGNKFAREATSKPVFDVAIELHDDHYVIHTDVKESVSAILAHKQIPKGLTYTVPRHRMAVLPEAARPRVIQGGAADALGAA